MTIRAKVVWAGAALSILAPVAFFAIRLFWLDSYMADDLTTFYANSAYQADILLDNFPIYKQSYANSCGPTTLSMVYSYLVEPISEETFAKRFDLPWGENGMLPAQFFAALQASLGKDHVEQQVNVPDSVLLENIYLQLRQGIPVPIYFSTISEWDSPKYDTHYSVVIGLRPQKQVVIIANAYGSREEMLIPELLTAMKYSTFEDASLDFRLGVFFGVIDKNYLFLIHK